MEREVCTCCYLRYAPERFSLTDKRPQVCTECAKHTGRAELRDREHLQAWRAEYGQMRQTLEGRIQNMHKARESVESELAATRQDLAQAVSAAADNYFSAPIGALRNAIETDVVLEEKRRMDAAYRQRDRAMATIWKIDQLHNALGGRGNCKCGLPNDRCLVLKALAPFTDELDRWEDTQKTRLREGQDHGLPREHPAVIAEGGVAGAYQRPSRPGSRS